MLDPLRIVFQQRLRLHELAHRSVVSRQRFLSEIVAEVLHEQRLHLPLGGKPDQVGQLMQVLAHEDHHHAHLRQAMPGQGAGVPQQTQIAHDFVEVGADPDSLVRLRGRSVDRHVEAIETASNARGGASLVEQGQV